MAVSAMKCGLLPLAQTSMRFARIAYHDYEGVAINLEEQERMVRDLGDHAGMILRNHGLLVVGASIPEAFNNIFRLERACQVQVAALSCNTELQLPAEQIVDASYRLYLPGTRRPFGVLEWPALLKKLDKIDPSYRD
jgi:ribulose-5-phosphate 4-epimerase/fuculose-1-phosphate aldolase